MLRPDGKPLAGARLLEIQSGGSVSIQDGVPNVAQGRLCREDRTGPDGAFSIPQYKKPWFVFILGDDSYAMADEKSLAQSPRVQAKPYARIEGQYRIGSQPAPNRELALSGMIQHAEGTPSIFLDQKATTDSEGRFTFKTSFLPPACASPGETQTSGRASGRSANRSTSSLAKQPRPCSVAKGGRSSAGSSHPRAGRCPSTSTTARRPTSKATDRGLPIRLASSVAKR